MMDIDHPAGVVISNAGLDHYSESFNSRLRDEFLNQEPFTCLPEACVLAERHRVYHNLDRPHSSLGYQTPAEFAASLTDQVPLPCVAGEVLDSPEDGEEGMHPQI